MKQLTVALLLISLLACSSPKQMSTYYQCYSSDSVNLYAMKSTEAPSIVIPASDTFYATKETNTYRIVNYHGHAGYVVSRHFLSEIDIKRLKEPIPVLKAPKPKTAKERAREEYDKSVKSMSNRSDSIANINGSGGSVQVKGYYRKNGTYVAPYTRSAPSRRK